MRSKKPLIGFVGQGWIGRAYADNFEERGYSVVRYSLEKEYVGNKNKIKDCDIVFIAVWTPTTPNGFDDSVIRSVLKLVGKGKIFPLPTSFNTLRMTESSNPFGVVGVHTAINTISQSFILFLLPTYSFSSE